MDADLVLLNGRSITTDHRLPISQGLAVVGGRILLVSDNAGVQARMSPGTEIIDLGGRAVLPGFLEAHCHPPFFGRSLRSIDCRPDSVRDLSQFLAAVQAEAARREGGLWIRGRGYDDLRLPPKSALTRHDTDPVSPHHPVCLTR